MLQIIQHALDDYEDYLTCLSISEFLIIKIKGNQTGSMIGFEQQQLLTQTNNIKPTVNT